jgi:hypothetical protein
MLSVLVTSSVIDDGDSVSTTYNGCVEILLVGDSIDDVGVSPVLVLDLPGEENP